MPMKSLYPFRQGYTHKHNIPTKDNITTKIIKKYNASRLSDKDELNKHLEHIIKVVMK